MPPYWFMNSTVFMCDGHRGGPFDVVLLEDRPGFLAFQAVGKGAVRAFRHEAGGMRWQRVPPTEKRGRTHTSTVTIAVLPLKDERTVQLKEKDLEWQATRGSGPGGQHRNKTSSAVILTHKPTGLVVRVENERSQYRNLQTAKAILSARLQEAEASSQLDQRNQQRKAQVGRGMRSDKVRTIALQRDQVTDHRLGKRISAVKYLRGELDKLVG